MVDLQIVSKSDKDTFGKWEKLKDMADQLMDIMLNYRQSGHPGGSRSKMHMHIALFLGGAMRWDIRNPHKRFADRFILSAGHVVPGAYAILALFNEALRRKYSATQDAMYKPAAEKKAVFYEDLVTLRYRGGLPGHPEMAGKTHFFKANTGPSGHGMPVAAGEAMALKYAGANDVRVFAVEGEGGLTPGAMHETLNSSWGLGLGNLYFLVDWNDFGIDSRPFSSVVYGNPEDWFVPHGWRISGTEHGSDWTGCQTALTDMMADPDGEMPSMAWFKTRKGRGYGVYDNKSHGVPHPFNSDLFWATKKEFTDKYGIAFDGYGQTGPDDAESRRKQALNNLQRTLSLFDKDPELLDYLADRLVELGESVPESKERIWFSLDKNPLEDPAFTEVGRLPDKLFLAPGTIAPNRAGLNSYSAWLNAEMAQKYGRPLFLAMSADLADSTNISGFGKDFGEIKGYGNYNRSSNLKGCMLPQGITEFANAGICTGLAATNFAADPEEKFVGFFAACSTYGSFSYLKYGPFRLFSQITQDAGIKLGKILWVVGHSGPETAEDSRTHFGVFSPAVTQLFPKGKVINLYPWEYNEVAPMITAALATDVNIIALHLTRPGIAIPDRKKLGMPSHKEAARGAYIIRDYAPDKPRQGTVFVQGTSTTANVVKILDSLESQNINIKLVAAVSQELFARQSQDYQRSVVNEADWNNSTFVTNSAAIGMTDWTGNRLSSEYSLSADWDNNWRTGGALDQVIDEAHLSPDWILKGLKKFAEDYEIRMSRLGI